MKFEFKPNESRIYDYVLFPRIIYSDKEKHLKDDSIDKEIVSDDFLRLMAEIESKLKPYAAEIEKYYAESVYTSHDFQSLVLIAFPVPGYQDENRYLDQLAKVDAEVLKRKLTHAMIVAGEEEEVTQVPDTVDDKEAIAFIGNLKIDAATKWNLLTMIQEPKQFLDGFIRLLTAIKPLFDSYYLDQVQAMAEAGKRITAYLDQDPENHFQELAGNSVNMNVIEGEECDFYVSYFFPYSLRIITKFQKDALVWGYLLAEAFKKINQLNEDLLNQRVKVFKVLGDKTRYETLKLIAKGNLAFKDIASELGVSAATISYHVNEFLTSGVITYNKESKKSGYLVSYDKLDKILEDFRKDLGFPEKKAK